MAIDLQTAVSTVLVKTAQWHALAASANTILIKPRTLVHIRNRGMYFTVDSLFKHFIDAWLFVASVSWMWTCMSSHVGYVFSVANRAWLYSDQCTHEVCNTLANVHMLVSTCAT